MFDDFFIAGQEYSYGEARSILEDNHEHFVGLHPNVTAYTYNRWNLGQTDINAYFDYTDRNVYKYLGPNFPYNGPCYHYPQGQNSIYLIGLWTNGDFTFANPGIHNFDQWKESFQNNPSQFLVVGIGAHLSFEALDGSVVQNNRLVFKDIDPSQTGISIDSPLGSLILNKNIGDIFVFGNQEYRITQIRY
jgi:hypothetical protein